MHSGGTVAHRRIRSFLAPVPVQVVAEYWVGPSAVQQVPADRPFPTPRCAKAHPKPSIHWQSAGSRLKTFSPPPGCGGGGGVCSPHPGPASEVGPGQTGFQAALAAPRPCCPWHGCLWAARRNLPGSGSSPPARPAACPDPKSRASGWCPGQAWLSPPRAVAQARRGHPFNRRGRHSSHKENAILRVT